MRIFNALRFKSLKTKAIGRYLLYAIGEIFLIVIGVLLALHFNSLDEEKKSHQRQLDYLRLIKNEMSRNLMDLNREIEIANRCVSNTKILLKIFNQPKGSITVDSLNKVMNRSVNAELKVRYNNGVLSEIKSAGGLREIENDTISILLASWDAKIEAIRLQEKDVYDYRELASNIWLEKGNAFETMPSASEFKGIGSNWDLLSDQKFTNVMLAYYATTRGTVNAFYIPYKSDIENLITMIDNELKKDNRR